jgi:hypothetical protein
MLKRCPVKQSRGFLKAVFPEEQRDGGSSVRVGRLRALNHLLPNAMRG